MFFRSKKKKERPLSLRDQFLLDLHKKAQEAAGFFDISPRQLQYILDHNSDPDRLISEIKTARTDPDIDFLIDQYALIAPPVVSPADPQRVLFYASEGDLIGSTREFSTHKPVTKENLKCAASHHTDDTALLYASFRAMEADPKHHDFESAYIEAYRKEPDLDYGAGFSKWARTEGKRTGYGSCGNGCIIRAAIIPSFFSNENDSDAYQKGLRTCIDSAMITHNHTEAIKALILFYNCIWLVRAKKSKDEVRAYCKQAFSVDRNGTEWERSCPSYSWNENDGNSGFRKDSMFAEYAVQMAVDFWSSSVDFEDCMVRISNIFCDADSLCAIAGALFGYSIQNND